MNNPQIDHPGYHGYRALLRVLFGPAQHRPDWQQHAACAGQDTAAFFTAEQADTARRVCAGCPVLTECRVDQLTWESRVSQFRAYPAGMVGGLSAQQRRALHRANATAKEVA
ncbi:WhiB family transcriptional regulator [Crossiella sp. CA198]|uniref:WhiB family transcriptional regulator n=1 Tax=Crossiella sp. CA198 TaxID=3455607 RepID=UPI003F8D5A6A